MTSTPLSKVPGSPEHPRPIFKIHPLVKLAGIPAGSPAAFQAAVSQAAVSLSAVDRGVKE